MSNTTGGDFQLAWESRERGTRYYTRSKRVNGRVVRQYIGTGTQAEMTAELDAIERAEREQKRLELKMSKQDDNMLYDYCRSVNVLVNATLVASGYHRHKHGEWRKRKGVRSGT